jgi:hypothetical protein
MIVIIVMFLFIAALFLVPHLWCWWTRRTAKNELENVLACCGRCGKLDVRGKV